VCRCRNDIDPTDSAILIPVRRVVFVAVPPIQILDLTAPFEVFARCGGYRVELATSGRSKVVTSSAGLSLAGAKHYRDLRGPIDTLMLPGGDGAEELDCDAAFVDWLRKTARRVRRVCSVCTGAFLLGAAGILDNRRAVTHWNYCGRLQQNFPRIRVERDPIYIRDDNIYTSAGVTAGLDLALALVEEDQGSQRAQQIARDMVMFFRRGGGQNQFSSLLSAQTHASRPIDELRAWVVEHLNADLNVPALAACCRMSARHFARVFVAEVGLTPARFVEQMRVEAARALLQTTHYSLKEAAALCGFGSPDTMRRSFIRVLGVRPGNYTGV
jgi:transcriptional regulator GlxA family with amidase domain